MIDVRYDPTWKPEGDEQALVDHIQHKLRCCDRSIPDFHQDQWLHLKDNWREHEADIPADHKGHNPHLSAETTAEDAHSAAASSGKAFPAPAWFRMLDQEQRDNIQRFVSSIDRDRDGGD